MSKEPVRGNEVRLGWFRWRPLRQRLIDSINDLTGDDACQDVVLLHERPWWVWPLAAVAVTVTTVVGVALPAPLYLVTSMNPLVIVLSFNLSGRPWVLARTGHSVLLAESPKLWPRATRVVEVAAAPLGNPERGRRFNKWSMVLFGRRVLVPPGSAHLVPRIID